MSISRGTWLRALQWNDQRCDRVLDRVERPLTAGVVAVLAAVAVAAFIASPGRADRKALEPLIEKARADGATYESAKPGDVVDWCIDHPSHGFSFLAGKPSHPILWAADDATPLTWGTHSACERMLARVVSREPQGLKLEFLGKP